MQTPEISTNEPLINDDVKVIVHKKVPCRVELEVHATKSLLEKARHKAIKEINKEVTLPGFRKGKAPENMILQKYPQDVERRERGQVADLGFMEAQKLARVPVLNNNAKITFDLKKIDENGAELSYAFDTEPTTPTVDPKKFEKKEVEKKEVGETEIEEGIRQMSFFYAKWHSVEDRGIEEGDFVIIDLDTVDDEGKETRVFDQIRFEVKPERMAEWMRKLALGAKMGQTLEGMSSVDDTASEEEKKEFKPKKVKLHIQKVERAELPEINDEFAVKVGAKDVAAMKEMVANVLKGQVEDKANRDLRDQVNQFLMETYQFDLPNSIVDAEFEHRLNQGLAAPDAKKRWETTSEEEKEKIKQNLKKEAFDSLRLFYLARQIVQDAKISISHQEVNNEAIRQKRERFMGMAPPKGDQLSKEEYAVALSTVVLTKAQDYILGA